jgi:hypothetical protein
MFSSRGFFTGKRLYSNISFGCNSSVYPLGAHFSDSLTDLPPQLDFVAAADAVVVVIAAAAVVVVVVIAAAVFVVVSAPVAVVVVAAAVVAASNFKVFVVDDREFSASML